MMRILLPGRRVFLRPLIGFLLFNSALLGQWPQWGGPGRDFQAAPAPLAMRWPPGGPPVLWKRKLGEGTSALSIFNGSLYTLYRRAEQEVIISLSADTGEVLWEYAYDAPLWAEFQAVPSKGPHSTPLVTEDFVIAAGIRGRLTALERKSGKLAWAHDFWDEYRAEPRVSGYACSPLLHEGLVIVPVGGPESGIQAFGLRDGAPVWKTPPLQNSYSSPLLIHLGGKPQVVVLLAKEVLGIDPSDGRLLWRHPHENVHGVNVTLPVFGADNLLFISSGYDAGSRMLRLTQSSEGTQVEEVWANRRMKIHHGNAVRMGDVIYASSGDLGVAFLAAVDVSTGELLIRQRGFSKATLVAAGQQAIVLDENGELALATPSREGWEIHSQAHILDSPSWTVPTLVGTRLYLRDRKVVLALDLAP